MPDPDGQTDASYADKLLAALTAGGQDRPESRVLDHLLGTWRVTTAWEPIVGHGVRHLEGRMETRWILDGRVLESCSFELDGKETTKLLIAFDRTLGDYAAYSVSVLSSFFALERGHRADDRTLVFDGFEPVHSGAPAVHFRRTIELVADGRYTSAISYPDVPPGTYGPMSSIHERID